ncbi:MAG: acyltransferase [Aeromicrobium sp.]|uniref:acyltransferase family protein n=1 Tax=Aeromicrobium sp. TaxID=1871063 RepID=UPI0039E2E05A
MTPTAPPRAYPELDGLRALAALAVVGTHTGFWAGVYGHGLLGAAAHRLEAGVAVFFVLSAFLLGRPHVARALTGAPVEPARRYYRKRFFRVWPVYAVTVVAALLILPQNRGAGLWTWLWELSLVDHLTGRRLPEGLTQMWSLSVEVCFYLVLPLLGWLLARAGGGWAGGLLAWVGLLAVGGVAYSALVWSVDAGWAETLRHQLPAYLPWFAAGLFLAVLAADADAERPRPLTQTAVVVARERLACRAAAAALFVVLATPVGGPVGLFQPGVGGALARQIGYGLIALLVVAPSVLAPRATSPLAHPLLRHLGRTSYALFCCHLTVLALIVEQGGLTQFAISWPLLFLGTAVVGQLVGEVLYRCVERPSLRLGRGRTSAEAATTANAASAHH